MLNQSLAERTMKALSHLQGMILPMQADYTVVKVLKPSKSRAYPMKMSLESRNAGFKNRFNFLQDILNYYF